MLYFCLEVSSSSIYSLAYTYSLLYKNTIWYTVKTHRKLSTWFRIVECSIRKVQYVQEYIDTKCFCVCFPVPYMHAITYQSIWWFFTVYYKYTLLKVRNTKIRYAFCVFLIHQFPIIQLSNTYAFLFCLIYDIFFW